VTKTPAAAGFGILFAASMAAQQFYAPTRPPYAPVPAPPVHPVFVSPSMVPPGEPLARRTPTPLPPGNPQARGIQSDGSSVDAIIAALYASVSHGPESEPNWKRMQSLFLPAGILIPPKRPSETTFTVLDLDGFQDFFTKATVAAKQRGETGAFFETEADRQLDCFGNVCQAFSTYASRRAPSEPQPFARGINSIQLVNDGNRWWIASVAWDTERTDNAIPARYDKK
jgi:hypothetical protein